MTSTSETMIEKWQDHEFRERNKRGRDRYWSRQMKKRLAKLANGTSKVDNCANVGAIVEEVSE